MYSRTLLDSHSEQTIIAYSCSLGMRHAQKTKSEDDGVEGEEEEEEESGSVYVALNRGNFCNLCFCFGD